jgi:hypothetical protein
MDRLANRIITPLSIQQAEEYCKTQNFETIRFEVKAMWDTGSTGCCISKNLANSLGLKAAEKGIRPGSILYFVMPCLLDLEPTKGHYKNISTMAFTSLPIGKIVISNLL